MATAVAVRQTECRRRGWLIDSVIGMRNGSLGSDYGTPNGEESEMTTGDRRDVGRHEGECELPRANGNRFRPGARTGDFVG